MPGTRKLGRTTSHRTAMLRALVTFLLENGKIETTVTRAKEVRSLTEKMITIAKENNLHNRRLVLAFVTKEDVVSKLFNEIAPKYADRNGGYCRITKLGPAAATRLRWPSSSSSEPPFSGAPVQKHGGRFLFPIFFIRKSVKKLAVAAKSSYNIRMG